MSCGTFIDLFAGIGGIRLGVEEALLAYGIEPRCVMTCEIDRHAHTTYSANFKDSLTTCDIYDLDEKSLAPYDLLLAGFPCQPFSQAGLKLGFQDTRGTLFFEIERLLRHNRPKAFLLENVKQLKGHDKGRTLKKILAVLESLGYTVSYDVLNTKHFGLPQNRERIFIVGFLNPISPFVFPTGNEKNVCVGDVLDDNVDEKYTLSDNLWQGHQRRKQMHLEKGNGFGYSLFYPDSPYTSTISARYYKDGSEILIHQDHKNPRKISPREAARLQGFPERFVIPVSDTQAYKQFGNSVSVPVIRAIVQAMLPILYTPAVQSSYDLIAS
jgi:DNA (cytosine-5)-methyltransferase 1